MNENHAQLYHLSLSLDRIIIAEGQEDSTYRAEDIRVVGYDSAAAVATRRLAMVRV